MGNLVSQDVEGGYNRFCEELVANDAKHQSGCLHWASPPLKKDQLDHFKECLSKNNCLKRLVLRDIDTLEDRPSLAKVIQRHPTLTCLGFNGRLPKQGFEVFVEAFLESATLTEFEIENSIIHPNIVDGMTYFLQQQQQQDKAKLTSLALKGCQMEADQLGRLTKALLESSDFTAKTLKTLEITQKPPILAVESAQHLSQFFAAPESVLEEIQLAGFLENALAVLLEGGRGHRTLKRLTLQGVGLQDEESMESIGRFLPDAPALEVLNLSSCNLDGACGTKLAQALKSVGGLKELYLGHNSLSNEGAIALSQAIQDPASPCRETLQVLDLCMNGIGEEGMIALAKSMQTNPPAFQQLHIGEKSIRNSRSFQSKEVEALADMIRENKTLLRLHMEDASFEDDGLAKLLETMASNTTMKELYLACFTTTSLLSIFASIPRLHLEKIHIRVQGQTQLDEAAGQSVLEALGENKSLREFAISEVTGPSAAVWRALEPKIRDFLTERTVTGENEGTATKRSMEVEVKPQDAAKRAKSE